MAHPIIAYRSLLRDSGVVITDPGSDAAYPITNLYDMRASSKWQFNSVVSPVEIYIDTGATARDADYLALVNHNLSSLGAYISVYNGVAYPPMTERLAPVVPTSDDIWYSGFINIAGAIQYWLVYIEMLVGDFAAKPFIGELYLGKLNLLSGYVAPSFDPFFSQRSPKGQRSSGGHYIAGSTRRTHRGNLSFGAAGLDRSELEAFYEDHALKRYPFFFLLDSTDSDFSTPYFIKLADDADALRMSVGGLWSRLTYDMAVEEAYSEAAP